jgi:hypothetical protein
MSSQPIPACSLSLPQGVTYAAQYLMSDQSSSMRGREFDGGITVNYFE